MCVCVCVFLVLFYLALFPVCFYFLEAYLFSNEKEKEIKGVDLSG